MSGVEQRGLIGIEIEVLLLNKNMEPVDLARWFIKRMPRETIGIRGFQIGLTRVVKELYPSMLEINFRPFWEDEFDHVTAELQNTLKKLWEIGSKIDVYPCLIGAPPSIPPGREIRPGETCAVHFHYSWGGGFLRPVERIPYYNGFAIVYLLMLPITLSSGFLGNKKRAFLGDRFKLATALFPPVYITEENFDFDYILQEIELMSAELGSHHSYPRDPRLLDIAPLTKEEAYFLLSRKSTVEVRAFDTVPSLLLIRALWILIAAMGRFIHDHIDAFKKVERQVFKTLWFLRSRVIKRGFKATTIPISPALLPRIDGEPWPRSFLEPTPIKEALLQLIEDLKPYIEKLGETSTAVGRTMNKLIEFIRDGQTPAEKLYKVFEAANWKERLLEILEWAIYNLDFVP